MPAPTGQHPTLGQIAHQLQGEERITRRRSRDRRADPGDRRIRSEHLTHQRRDIRRRPTAPAQSSVPGDATGARRRSRAGR